MMASSACVQPTRSGLVAPSSLAEAGVDVRLRAGGGSTRPSPVTPVAVSGAELRPTEPKPPGNGSGASSLVRKRDQRLRTASSERP